MSGTAAAAPSVTPWPASMFKGMKGIPPMSVWAPPLVMVYAVSDQMGYPTLVACLLCMVVALCAQSLNTIPTRTIH